jgi:hypothetical protein
MSISSVSSNSSVLWEQYLERQKKLQQRQTSSESGSETGKNAIDATLGLTPDQLISELQSLSDDPEKLKARAAELAAEAKEAAAVSKDKRGDALKELAADLETVASTGDLSVMQEKLANRQSATGSEGPSGMGGGAGARAKSVQGLLEEDEDDENHNGIPDSLEEFLAKLEEFQQLLEESDEEKAVNIGNIAPDLAPSKLASELQGLEGDPEKLKARAAELAVQAKEAAMDISDNRAGILKELAADLEDVAETGDLATMLAKLSRSPGAANTVNAGETNGTQGVLSLDALVAKLHKLKEAAGTGSDGTAEAEAAGSESQESIKAFISSITASLSKQIQAVYAQSGTQYSTVSLSG